MSYKAEISSPNNNMDSDRAQNRRLSNPPKPHSRSFQEKRVNHHGLTGSKAYDMRWRYAIVKKIKDWKIDGKMLCFIENFMKERTLRVAVGTTLLNATIENGFVQGAVLSVTLFFVAMSEICNGI
jgi:hypothetical protein